MMGGLRNYPCSVDGCDRPAQSRGWCSAHYMRWHRHGTTDLLTAYPARGTIEAFLQKALAHTGTDCLFWPFGTNGRGYGQIRRSKKSLLVHRLICRAHHGAPPTPSHESAHSCGNGHRGCISPKHLRWATRAENASDLVAHGTLRGNNAKLTNAQVLEIFRRAAAGENQRVLAAEFCIAQTCVSLIKRQARWGWLTGGAT